jgi:hypothetical protein
MTVSSVMKNPRKEALPSALVMWGEPAKRSKALRAQGFGIMRYAHLAPGFWKRVFLP